jgi:hypothetical protein
MAGSTESAIVTERSGDGGLGETAFQNIGAGSPHLSGRRRSCSHRARPPSKGSFIYHLVDIAHIDPGRVGSHDMFDRSIDARILRSRPMPEPHPSARRIIQPERGIGCLFDPACQEAPMPNKLPR